MDLILSHRGNYKALLTFKKATVIYDLTFFFCHHYLSSGDRTVDQMIQAARSGKQNIAEGVAASSTNAETEIKLINVAKASLKELLTDFEDYLRTRRLSQWALASPELEWVRQKARTESDSAFWLAIAEKRDAHVLANIIIVLLKQEDYLLFKQLEALERQFKSSGDLHGRLKGAGDEIELANFKRDEKAARTLGLPRCPCCGELMSRQEVKAKDWGFDRKWFCFRCKTEQLMPRDEYEAMEKERRRAIMMVKFKYDRLLRRWSR